MDATITVQLSPQGLVIPRQIFPDWEQVQVIKGPDAIIISPAPPTLPVRAVAEAPPAADAADDALVGLFAGPPDLAARAEEYLALELTEHSGWTWKEPRA